MKPIIILCPDAMSEENIKLLRENDLCVVVAKNPAAVKFVDPIPAASSRTSIENAAIKLSRKILTPGFWNSIGTRENMAAAYIDILVKGTPLDPYPEPTPEEREKEIFDSAKADELRKLAREEAKAQREAAKKKLAEAAVKK